MARGEAAQSDVGKNNILLWLLLWRSDRGMALRNCISQERTTRCMLDLQEVFWTVLIGYSIA